VTHEHGDHYDEQALKLLSGKKTQVVLNGRCAEMYGQGKAMKNGDKMQISKQFSVEAVPAYNTTEGREKFHPKGRDNGYILTLDGLRIYIAGDTEDISEMEGIKDIDIAFLPCNQPYTMTVEQLVAAAKVIKPKVVFPYHYNNTPVTQAVMKLAGTGIEVRIRDYK
jgi:L-ascorbate metabolism protein UlaG (beta-lactamase superfamily)